MIVKHTFKAHCDRARSENDEQVVLSGSEARGDMTKIEGKVVVTAPAVGLACQ